MIKLREYQQDAINNLYQWLKNNTGNPCVVAPTGSGKAILIAEMVRLCVQEWKGRVLVLAHVKELLEQEGEKLSTYLPEIKYTYYSAGIGEKDFNSNVVIAGIQSIYNHADEAGLFNLVLIDEAHLIPPEGDGMYRTFLEGAKKNNPNVRFIGFTATPFRTGSGSIVGDGKMFDEIASTISVQNLISQGYLSPLVMKGSRAKYDCAHLHIRAGEFRSDEVEELVSDPTVVSAACRDLVERSKDRKSVLIFASSVSHAVAVQKTIQSLTGERCELITGDTPTDIRNRINAEFRGLNDLTGEQTRLKYLVNVNVLTTGFDAPGIDCVALLRPTASPVLYVQMVGRGFRIAPGKENCLILDYGGNAVRHGAIDGMFSSNMTVGKRSQGVLKECPECLSVIAGGCRTCPECGYEYPVKERSVKHLEEAGDGILFVGQKEVKEYNVISFQYREWKKKDWKQGDPVTVRCDYLVCYPDTWVSEWVCPEHTGWTRGRFENWWKKRSNVSPPPLTAFETCYHLYTSDSAKPKRVRVVREGGKKFPEVSVIELTEIDAPWREICGTCIHYQDGFCNMHNQITESEEDPCEDFFNVKTPMAEEELPF